MSLGSLELKKHIELLVLEEMLQELDVFLEHRRVRAQMVRDASPAHAGEVCSPGTTLQDLKVHGCTK